MPVTMEQETISDDALAEACRSGDERAARALVERHAEALGRFLYGAGAAPAEVEDLAQETFFRAFRGLDGWRRDASFRTWLLAIGANLLRDAHRRRRGWAAVPLDGHDAPDHRDPDAELAARDAEARLLAGLERLTRLQREVFLLRAQQGAGYDEIAAVLGTTPGAARVHYHHAVRRLKELVG
jgi:RNA polymerase sigma-70 factor (ECF subfamily)